MRFALLGSDNFAAPLRGLGHEVLFCATSKDADIKTSSRDAAWPELARKLGNRGFKPDAVIVCDDIGYRTLPVQLYDSDVITVFYGVDSPLNRFWQMPYARLFDLAFLDQPAEAEHLAAKHHRSHWLPVGIEPEYYVGRHTGALLPGGVFVGVVNQKVRPKRSALLNLLGSVAPMEIAGGRGQAWFPTEKAAACYRGHQFVLNENLFSGLTTRPLEVMASGGALLTEEAPGAMDRHFRDGKHLLYFSPQSLRQKLYLLLEDSALRDRLARSGREAVLSGHTLAHRAEQLVGLIEDIAQEPRGLAQRPRGRVALYLEGRALFTAGLRWPGKGGGQRVLAGAGRLLAAAGDTDRPTPMSKWAGLAALVLGESDICLKYLQMATESGGAEERLLLALAAAQLGKARIAKQAVAALGPEVSASPQNGGPASLNLAAARILAQRGRSFTPGFDARKLPPAMWSGLEHMIQTCQAQPENGFLWEELGDLLLANNAPNEAHHSYAIAERCGGSPRLAEKLMCAKEKGYLQWARH